ncbi:MAG: hypothetical protein AUI36_03245, partial [Cyanobacteria bacterium 13_1_40CM_2_61_4]
GDVDGDGFDDFFILRPYGAPEGWVGTEEEGPPGVVYLLHGAALLPAEVGLDSPPAGVRVTVFTSTKHTPTGVALSVSVGDLNGDGRPDFAFGAGFSAREVNDTQYSPGRVYVLFADDALEGVVDVEEAGRERPGIILEGDEDGADFGTTVTFTGDVNGDGMNDLLIGARSAYGWRPSWAYILFGAPKLPPFLTVDDLLGGLGVRFTGTGPAAFTGESLGAPGDVNGDGLADFVIGARGAASQAGEAYLVYGRPRFEPDIELADVPSMGLGVAFRGEHGDVFGGDFAGWSVAALDFLGDGRRDLVLGAPGFAYRENPRVGRAYIIEGAALGTGVRSLGEVEGGTLVGALLTAEVSLAAPEHHEPHLGEGAAALGDVDGDGFEDLLVAAPAMPFAFPQAGAVHLVYGRGGAAGALRLERVEPDAVALAGGEELTLFGAGFDDRMEVRIGGAPAPLQRAITSARVVVKAPPLDRKGPADVTLSRGGETATLPGGIRYVERVHPDLDPLEASKAGKAAIIRGKSSDFASSLAFLDIDGDGFSDVVAATGTGNIVVIYGSAQPAAELELPDLDGGEMLEGASLIHAGLGASCSGVGDINGDGKP